MVQVAGAFGAGVEKGWGPAPLERTDVCFAAQVPRGKTHLRQCGEERMTSEDEIPPAGGRRYLDAARGGPGNPLIYSRRA